MLKKFTHIIQQLGGFMIDTPQIGDILICDKIYRTFKFLFAVCKGIPIVRSTWLEMSHKHGKFEPTDPYLLTDYDAEKRFGFSLKKSIGKFCLIILLYVHKSKYINLLLILPIISHFSLQKQLEKSNCSPIILSSQHLMFSPFQMKQLKLLNIAVANTHIRSKSKSNQIQNSCYCRLKKTKNAGSNTEMPFQTLKLLDVKVLCRVYCNKGSHFRNIYSTGETLEIIKILN